MNPKCLHRFKTSEQDHAPASAPEVTTESVMASFNLKRERNPDFDAEAIAAAIAVDKRKAIIRREQRHCCQSRQQRKNRYLHLFQSL